MSNETAPIAPYRILIVEDDESIARLIAACLKPLKFETKYAPDGAQALAAFEVTKPHLVLLDVMLPQLDGREVLRRIRETSTVPVILISARHGEEDQLGGFKLGADDYIAKPFNPHLLVARVVAQLRRAYKYAPPVNTETNVTVATNAPISPDEQKRRDMMAAARSAGGRLPDELPKKLPIGWAQCDHCGYMGPRAKFEGEDALGRLHTSCPSCGQTESVVFSIDLRTG